MDLDIDLSVIMQPICVKSKEALKQEIAAKLRFNQNQLIRYRVD